jgi:hypothetical protein
MVTTRPSLDTRKSDKKRPVDDEEADVLTDRVSHLEEEIAKELRELQVMI